MGNIAPLNAVRAFVTAARHGSFKDAARELYVTPGAVSRQIQNLEQHLGVRLFERGARQVTLTEAGSLYFAKVGAAIAAIEEAGERVGAPPGRGLLRVDCIPTFAMHWLLPRLHAFQNEYPAIEVALSTALGSVTGKEGWDVAIRRDPEHFRGLPAERLMDEYCVPVCSPHMPGLQALRDSAGFARHKLIHIRARPDLWPTWFQAQGLQERDFPDRLMLDQTFFAIKAAEEGLGIAMVPSAFVEAPLAGGTLIVPLGLAPVRSGSYYVVRRDSAPHEDDAPQRFCDWLAQRAPR